MLVLTRKRSESVKIGDNIVIKVIQTGRGMVKLGIEAPSDVRVLRGELAEFTPAPSTTAHSDESTDLSGHGPSDKSDRMTPKENLHVIDYTTDFAADLEDQMFYLASLVD